MKKHLGVRFVYEKSNEQKMEMQKAEMEKTKVKDQLTPESLAKLPDTLRTSLQQAVKKGAFTKALNIIEEISDHDNEHLADLLADLVNSFKFDTLNEFFEKIGN